jgi:hypothetical protein
MTTLTVDVGGTKLAMAVFKGHVTVDLRPAALGQDSVLFGAMALALRCNGFRMFRLRQRAR